MAKAYNGAKPTLLAYNASKAKKKVSGSGGMSNIAYGLLFVLALVLILYTQFLGDKSQFEGTSDENQLIRPDDAAEVQRYGGGQVEADSQTHRRPKMTRAVKVSEGTLSNQSLASGSSQLNIAFCVTTADNVRNIKRWMRYHQLISVTHFYIFAEGQAAFPEALEELRRYRGVRVFPPDEKLQYHRAHSHVWQEYWLSAFFNKPCNAELFVRQSLNMEVALKQAWEDKVSWILHIDTDELIYPGGSPDFTLQSLFSSLPQTFGAPQVDTYIFPNYEALPEKADVTDSFTEVSLFKRNYNHISQEYYFKHYKDVAHGNPNYFITYGNGKSAARMIPSIRPNGAHRWQNYKSRIREVQSDTAAVLHFTYNKFDDLKSRRDRCDCAPTDYDVQRCFFLPFDRQAFIASSLLNETELHEFFVDRLVWQDRKIVSDLVHKGVFIRFYTAIALFKTFDQLPDFGLPLKAPDEDGASVIDRLELSDTDLQSTSTLQKLHTSKIPKKVEGFQNQLSKAEILKNLHTESQKSQLSALQKRGQSRGQQAGLHSVVAQARRGVRHRVGAVGQQDSEQ